MKNAQVCYVLIRHGSADLGQDAGMLFHSLHTQRKLFVATAQTVAVVHTSMSPKEIPDFSSRGKASMFSRSATSCINSSTCRLLCHRRKNPSGRDRGSRGGLMSPLSSEKHLVFARTRHCRRPEQRVARSALAETLSIWQDPPHTHTHTKKGVFNARQKGNDNNHHFKEFPKRSF